MRDKPQQRASDEAVRRELKARGYRVVVIRYDEDIKEQIEKRTEIFGNASV